MAHNDVLGAWSITLKLPTNLQCSTCCISYSPSNSGKGYVAKVLFQGDTFKVYTVFTEAMTGFLESAYLADSADLHKQIKDELTMKVSYIPDGDKLKLIEKLNE